MLNRDLLIGGDGSVKNKLGTYGYKLQLKTGDSITGSGKAFGSKAGMSSLRAEHHGEIAILLILTGLCTYFNITNRPDSHIHIDNKEVVDRGTKQMEQRKKLRDYVLSNP